MSHGARTSVYRRVLLKLSGEALMGQDAYGINRDVLTTIAGDIGQAVSTGVQLGIVVGGGNIYRGLAAAAQGGDRATADYMGMMATVMNALALQEALERNGLEARVQSALRIDQVVEPYVRRRAIRHLEKGRVIIFAAGTGSPFFTTDTAATLRGAEIKAELVLKGTKVDGVYSKDPVRYPDATRYERLTYDEVLDQRLEVMDATAVALCREQKLPLRVFNIHKSGALGRIMLGANEGTLVWDGGKG